MGKGVGAPQPSTPSRRARNPATVLGGGTGGALIRGNAGAGARRAECEKRTAAAAVRKADIRASLRCSSDNSVAGVTAQYG